MRAGERRTVWTEYLELRERCYRAAVACGLLGFALFITVAVGIRLRPDGWGWAGVAVPGGILGVWLLVATVRYSALSVRVWTWPCPVCGGLFALSVWSAWPGERCRRCGARAPSAEPGAAPDDYT